jgi:hypothetical protein
MRGMSSDTWLVRDLPVLEAIVELTDEGETNIGPQVIARRTGIDVGQVNTALGALADESPSLFHSIEVTTADGKRHFAAVERPIGGARRRVGGWPTPESLADQLLAAFGAATAAESDAAKKSKLQGVAEFLGGVGRDVLVSVTSGILTRSM